MMSVSTKHHLYSKGAPDVLLKKCDTLLLNGGKIVLSSMQKEHILKQNHNPVLRQILFSDRPLPAPVSFSQPADGRYNCWNAADQD